MSSLSLLRGLGDAESEFCGARRETPFGPLTVRLGVADVHTGGHHFYEFR